MAFIAEPSAEDQAQWVEWIAELPENVRTVVEKHGFVPWKLYRLKTSGHRVTLGSFDEGENDEVTLKVDVLGKFNLISFERSVFGVKPEDLEECELPADDEPLGAALTQEEIAEIIAQTPPGPPRAEVIERRAKEALQKIGEAKVKS